MKIATQWIVIYPVDSVTHLLNNWGQVPTVALLGSKILFTVFKFSIDFV